MARSSRAPTEPRLGAGAIASLASRAGVAAVIVIAVLVNVLAARFHRRWDWTSEGLYTLSPATLGTLGELERPVDVVVFLPRTSALGQSFARMLETYEGATDALRVRFVDPDQDATAFRAFQEKYGLREGRSEDGRVLTDAVAVIALGERRWFLTEDDLVQVDVEAEAGRTHPRLEQALTEGLRGVLDAKRVRVCFSTGHGELSVEDATAEGLMELKHRLAKDNFEPVVVDLADSKASAPLTGCDVAVVAGPEKQVDERTRDVLRRYVEQGGNLLLMLNADVGDDGRLRPIGLEPLAALAGVRVGTDLVVERDAGRQVPGLGGLGFHAETRPHALTAGLADVIVQSAQSLSAEGGLARPLLATSPRAFALGDLHALTEEGGEPAPGPSDATGPFTLAYAAELPPAAGGASPRGARVVVVGTASPALSLNWREPGFAASAWFTENALAWLAARPPILDIPVKKSAAFWAEATPEFVAEEWRYAMLFIPGTALALGVVLLVLRHRKERRFPESEARSSQRS